MISKKNLSGYAHTYSHSTCECPYVKQVFLGPHYIGRDMVIEFEESEYWNKVLGPVFIYLNSKPGPNNETALWEDAKAQAKAEAGKWPYNFPCSPDFAKAEERGSVTGRLWVRDRYFPIFRSVSCANVYIKFLLLILLLYQ